VPEQQGLSADCHFFCKKTPPGLPERGFLIKTFTTFCFALFGELRQLSDNFFSRLKTGFLHRSSFPAKDQLRPAIAKKQHLAFKMLHKFVQVCILCNN